MFALYTAIAQMSAASMGCQEWKDRIIDEWIESRNLPRKQKKLKRKHLKLDFAIQQYGEKMFNDIGL